jgi:hypothetical protein
VHERTVDIRTFEQFIMHWKQAKIESSVADGGVALEDGHNAAEDNNDKDRMLAMMGHTNVNVCTTSTPDTAYIPDFNTKGSNENECMQLKHHQKETSKLIKHFNEKVPKHANVGCKIRET